MSGISPKVGYQSVSTNTLVKSGPSGLYGVVSTVTGGAVTVYDNTAASGAILFTKTLAVGDVIHFGGNGIAANKGLYVAVVGTVVVMYT